jgi:hypothetical protein
VPAAVGVSVLVPLIASAPVQLPDAVQPVALLDDQVIVVDAPTAIDLAAKVRLGTAGGAAAVTVRVAVAATELPPAFVQVSVYLSVPAALGVSVCDPLAFSAPLQSPDAVQAVAVRDDQVMVTGFPATTEDADKVSVGAPGGISASAASA